MDNCPIHLSYASSAFGDSVIPNNKITVTPAVAFNTSTYADPNVLSTDWDKNTVALVMGLDYQQTSYNRVLLPQTDIKLMHVKMEIKQCYQPSDMFMINYLTVKNVCFFTKNATEPTTGNFYIYNDVIFNNHNNYVLCQPIITSFNNNLRAGVDMLIINGKHFGQGSVSGNYGKILFMDANAPNLGYSSYIQNLDDYDLVSWNDKQIKIRLSSRIIRSGQKDRTMGSGKFIIKTNIGDSVYSDSLNVKYAITQSPQIPSQNNKKFRYNMIDNNGMGSYTFRCDTSISNYPIRKAIVAKAIKDWNCKTGVNWKLGLDTTLAQKKHDGINLIFFDKSLVGKPAAETSKKSTGLCNTVGGTAKEAYYKEIDIRFSIDFSHYLPASISWFFDTTASNVPFNHVDFYGVLLHELGHAHSIGHVIDHNDIMYWQERTGIPAFQRNYNASKWYNTVDAGLDVVGYSEALGLDCSQSALISDIPDDCSIIDRVENEKELQGLISVYPNPTTGSVNIEAFGEGLIGISLFDIQGKLLFTEHNESKDSKKTQIDLSSFKSGMYLLKVETLNSKETFRLVVE